MQLYRTRKNSGEYVICVTSWVFGRRFNQVDCAVLMGVKLDGVLFDEGEGGGEMAAERMYESALALHRSSEYGMTISAGVGGRV